MSTIKHTLIPTQKLREPLVSDWSQEWSQPIWSAMANARCARRLSTSFRQLRSWAFRLVCLWCNRQLCDLKKSLKKMFVDNSDITKRDDGYVWESNLVIFRKFTFERVECKSFWFGFFILSLHPPILLPTNVSYVTNFPLHGLQKIVYDTRAGWWFLYSFDVCHPRFARAANVKLVGITNFPHLYHNVLFFSVAYSIQYYYSLILYSFFQIFHLPFSHV